MSRLTWRGRSVLAAGVAAVLMGTGVAALAANGSSPNNDAAPAAIPQPSYDSSAELRRSVDDLMGQAEALESSLAATPAPTATPGAVDRVVDDRGGDRPAGVSNDRPLGDDHGDEVEGDDD